MKISSSRPHARAGKPLSEPEVAKDTHSTTVPEDLSTEPNDSLDTDPGFFDIFNKNSQVRSAGRKLIPTAVAIGGATAGLVGGLTGGIPGGIGGAIAMGAAGASGVTVLTALEELAGGDPDYVKRATIGGALGAAFGGLVGGLSQSSGVAVGMVVAGTVGATLGYSFLKES